MPYKSGLKLFLATLLLGCSTAGAKAVTYTVTNTNDGGADASAERIYKSISFGLPTDKVVENT